MAAPMKNVSWRSLLNESAICKYLRESCANDTGKKTETDAKSLVAVDGAYIYVWDTAASCLLHTNLRSIDNECTPSYTFSISESKNVSKDTKQSCQTLMCVNPPRFDVENVLLSPTSSHVALSGPEGITILELPSRWGPKGEFAGGKETVLCQTSCLADRYLRGHPRSRVLQVAWHPGSSTGMHLVVLTSDNTLWVYELSSPESPIQSIKLNESEENGFSDSVSAYGIALGDVAVSFDFGVPVEVHKKSLYCQSSDSVTPLLVWPLFVLKGNGDVLSVYTDLNSSRSAQFPIHGPLTMHPPAEDNYGTDACSITCLPSIPPVLVIATSSGRLHHCVIVDSSDQADVSVSPPPSSNKSMLYQEPEEASLYVYETIELELSLTIASIDDLQQLDLEEFTCPIRLVKDNASSDRYHCCHAAGVHTVALPWIDAFSKYAMSESETDEAEPPCSKSIVEHLICTRPLQQSPPAPVLGLSVVTDHSLGITLLALTSDLEFFALPLRKHYQMESMSLLSAYPSQGGTSPLRQVLQEPFDEHIKNILHREVSNPILRSSKTSDLTQQECFQLLTRATQIFRDEYLLKQDLAREKIEKRVSLLNNHKIQQQHDLQHLEELRNILSENAESVAEKYEDIQTQQEKLLQRLEHVLRKVQSQLPLLSDAERNMHKELSNMEQQVKTFSNHLEQIRVKREYQERQISQARKSSSSSSSPSSSLMQNKQSSQLKDVLKHEGDIIGDLMKQINTLKLDLNA